MLSWAIRLEGRALWTENADPGTATYGESLRRFGGIESGCTAVSLGLVTLAPSSRTRFIQT